MGNCAGGPQRTLRDNHKTNRQKKTDVSLPLVTTQEDELIGTKNSMKNNQKVNKSQSTVFLQIPESTWKSQVVTKTIRQFVKPPTLQEEEQSKGKNMLSSEMNNLDKFVPSLKPIGTESLEQSIQARRAFTPEAYQLKYGHEELFGSQGNLSREIFDFGGSKYSMGNLNNNNKAQLSMVSEFSPIQNSLYYNPSQSSTLYQLPLKKKQKGLDQILEVFEKDTQTPIYVREIKTKLGEDIKDNNFGKMDAIVNFQEIDVRQYMEDMGL